ncbi:carbohydrate porin [Pseudomonas cerasi]
MRGDEFNYSLYYNYRLTPHLILRPNLQSTTKPGAVSDNSHRFVGGLSAGINF